jgi:hypothetical protein
MSESVLGTALAFARHGHGVFPVNWPQRIAGAWHCSCGKRDCGRNAGKHPFAPFAPTGVKSASTDPDTIRRWFERAPRANLGVATARLVVLDVDPRHGGGEVLTALEHEHEFPPTWRVLTGGGGEHVYFACPADVEISSSTAENNPLLGPGIDVRARGGYVIGPPSRHICGRPYAWSVDHHPADVQLAAAPPWLVEKLAQPKTNGGLKPPDPAEIARRRAGKIVEYRDMAVASVVGSLLRARSLDPAFVATLVQDWNACHCDPPLPEHEVEAIFTRIGKLEIKRRRAGCA